MIAVVVPAHDEQELLPGCLASIRLAAAHPDLAGEPVLVVVAADACCDGTAAVATESGAHVEQLDAGCVGAARRAGARVALRAGARWLASTDADSTVPADWLAAQLRYLDAGWDAVCGVVEVADWGDHGADVQVAHAAAYRAVEGHAHVHGASLGVTAAAYADVGGWQALPAHEDVALVESLIRRGHLVARSGVVRVVTSARRDHRAPVGFGHYLTTIV